MVNHFKTKLSKNKILLISCLLYALTAQVNAQVKIGNNPNTIDANSLLELESTNKGLLPPRVALISVSSVSPLTGTVPAGMLVYSSGGTVSNGYYYWSGSEWVPFKGESSLIAKTTSVTLTKNETFVLASNDITLTLPAITAADNGLSITIKHVGTHVHQVDVVRSGASTIDGLTISKHFRWMAKTYIASGGNWIIRGNEGRTDNVFDVSATGSWTTIAEVIEFLNAHMVAPSVVRLISGDYPILATQTISLAHPLTIQGSSYGAATILASGGVSGSLFDCQSESYFKMLAFDANGVSTDAIHLGTNYEYYEVKDCTFDGFDKAMVALSNVEFWVFEVDILNAGIAGIELDAGANDSVSFKISETDFIDCAIGIHFLTGTEAIISILNCGFYNPEGTGEGIKYVAGGASTTFLTMFITNNTWNNEGIFMDGFDFSLPSGRDANAFIRNNSGGPDKNPNCRINVNNNADTTRITTAASWYKAKWGAQSSITTKWTIEDAVVRNRIAYQPLNKSDGWAIISGNISANNPNRVISIGIVKNGVKTVRYGESDLLLKTASDPYQFSTTIYLTDILPGDYFELFCTSGNGGDVVTFRDVQWFTETK